MPVYFRTPSMQTGLGFICPSCEVDIKSVGFRCPNCNNYLVNRVLSTSVMGLECKRCKAYIILSVKEYTGNGKKKGIYVKANSPYNIELKCKRCKTSLIVKVREALPWVKKEEVSKSEVQAGVSATV